MPYVLALGFFLFIREMFHKFLLVSGKNIAIGESRRDDIL